ncbi:MAG: LysR family transcriptional regulator [Pusillimonas sp.]|nr:LysR family transcriptional regulator [Pusillimonas sp.]
MNKDNFLNRVRLRHIQCFVAVAQEQNLGKAAERLNLSQPAVSKTLVELEEMADTILVERGRFGARLTPDGELLLSHCVSVLDALEAAQRSLARGFSGSQESVSVGALPTVAPDLLPTALADFRTQYPQARLQVQVATNNLLLEKLKAGEVDLAVGRMADPQMMVGISFEFLYAEPLVAAVRTGHPLLAQGSAPLLADVVAHPLVISASGTVPRHNTESYFKERGMHLPDHYLETLAVSVARLVVLQSDAVWFTPAGAVRDDLQRGLLSALPLSFEGTEEPVGLLYRSEAPLNAPGQSLIRILRNTNRRKEGARNSALS